MAPEQKVKIKPPDKFKRWMIASLFLIPLVIFGSISAYYAYFPVKMYILISLLRYDRASDWASESLREEGEKAVPYLLDALSANETEVRSRLQRALGYIASDCVFEENQPENVIPLIIKALAHKNAFVRMATIRILTGLLLSGYNCKAAVPELIELLWDPDTDIRLKAVRLLRLLKSKEAGPHLVKLLSDPDAEVRGGAAKALSEIRPKQAVAPLIHFLEETPDPRFNPEEWWWFQYQALLILQKITGQNFGDVYGTSASERQKIIQKWLKWWEENKKEYEAGGEAGRWTPERVRLAFR